MAAELPVDTYERILTRMGGDAELLSDAAQILIEELPRHLDAIKQALDTHDAGALQRAAHSLKGAASNFEASAVVDAARRLEMMGRSGELEDRPKVWIALNDAASVLTRTLQAYVASQATGR